MLLHYFATLLICDSMLHCIANVCFLFANALCSAIVVVFENDFSLLLFVPLMLFVLDVCICVCTTSRKKAKQLTALLESMGFDAHCRET